MSRTVQQIQSEAAAFAASLANKPRASAALSVASRYHKEAANGYMWPIGNTAGGAVEVEKALAWANGLVAALEALQELE